MLSVQFRTMFELIVCDITLRFLVKEGVDLCLVAVIKELFQSLEMDKSDSGSLFHGFS